MGDNIINLVNQWKGWVGNYLITQSELVAFAAPLLCIVLVGQFLFYFRRKNQWLGELEQEKLEKDALDDQARQLELDLALSRERYRRAQYLAEELATAKRDLDQYNKQWHKEIGLRAAAEQKAQLIPKLESQLEANDARTAELTRQLALAQSQLAEISGRRDEENRAAEEKLQLLKQAEENLTKQFENLASRIFTEKEQRFDQHNQNAMESILAPFKQQLGDFRQKVDEIHHNDTKERSALREEIRQLGDKTQQMNHEALNLTRALKGDKKTQGYWGELVLERVLEQSGLRRGIEYELQGGYRDSNNRLMKPDVIVHLPERRDVIVDSKVSLVAYERYTTSDNENDKKVILQQHVDAIKNHIKGLSEKDYSSLKGLRSLDFVLLFMPIEGAFFAAHQQDDKLMDMAFEQKIVIVTPTTLVATLRTIANVWRYERQNENAKIIADRSGALYDKLRSTLDDFERIGQQLQTLQKTYASVMNKMTHGSGNLIHQASGLIELGVRVKKPISDTLLKEADLAADVEAEEVDQQAQLSTSLTSAEPKH